MERNMQIRDIIQKDQGYNGNNLNVPKSLKAAAQKLCREYNQTMPDEGEKRSEILHQLLGECSELTFIEPAFHCDYGFNIFTHGLVVINYNCTILDTSPVHIGENAVICGGVTIGEGSVIGAGSVVTKNIPPRVVAAGNPCKVIREVRKEDKISAEELAF